MSVVLAAVNGEPQPKKQRPKFKEGAVVCLKSGGAAMTVEDAGPVITKCTWINDAGDGVIECVFKNSMLQKFIEPKATK